MCFQQEGERIEHRASRIFSPQSLWVWRGKDENFLLRSSTLQGQRFLISRYPPTPHGKETQSESQRPALYYKVFIQISLKAKTESLVKRRMSFINDANRASVYRFSPDKHDLSKVRACFTEFMVLIILRSKCLCLMLVQKNINRVFECVLRNLQHKGKGG